MTGRARFTGRGNAVLIGICGLLCVGVIAELIWPHGLEPNPAPTSATEAVPPAPAPHLSDLDAYVAIWQAPLFTPDRRPYLPVVTVAPDTAEPAAPPPRREPVRMDFTLEGLASSATAEIVLLATTRSGGLERIRIGDALDGWVLTAVARDSATFRHGDIVRELRLETKDHSELAYRQAAEASP